MNSPISQIKTTPQICVPAPKLGFSSPLVSLPNQMKKRAISGWRIVKCAEESAADKIWIGKEEKELMIGRKKWSEKCEEAGGGIVELMECLEREAIMGEDEGREAIDYNRRALIFDKSGRLFQALKQQS